MLSSINRQHDRQELALLIIAVLSAALIHVSIAASQSLLGVGIGLMRSLEAAAFSAHLASSGHLFRPYVYIAAAFTRPLGWTAADSQVLCV